MGNIWKRIACGALCVLLLMSLTVLPVGAASYAPGTCNGRHSWVNRGWVKTEEVGLTECFGKCEAFYAECSVCGARQYIVFRGSVGPENHHYEEATLAGECEENPLKEKHCTVCGQTVTTGGKHDWHAEGDVIPRTLCTDYDTQLYRCAACGETKTENVGTRGSHTFERTTVEATCTTPGYTYLKCTTCGYETAQEHANPTGHDYTGSWQSDADTHWVVCSLCGQRLSESAHTYKDGTCTVCGRSDPACRHEEWTYTYNGFGSFSHTKTCVRCGYTVREGCSEGTADYTGRTDCTQPLYCLCGNKINDGQKRHNFGTYICHDETHEHHCLNRNCTYGTVEPHNVVTVSGVAKCSVCGFVLESLSAPHTHTFGTWTAGAEGCVRHCTDPGCDAVETAAHTPGDADCAGNAVCVTCGAAVKTEPGTIHVGATEVRNAVPAEVGKPGYTGDTVCVTCGAVLVPGQTIEALKPSHVHAFDTLAHDSTGHWKVCACGEREAAAAHTGGTATCAAQAVCAVCGEKYGELDAANHVGGTESLGAVAADVGKPGYTGDIHCLGCGALLERGTQIPALTPSHTHSCVLKSDSTGHWLECACGYRQEKAAHTYAGGVCTVCGEREPEKVEVHVHTFSAKWEADSTNHWHTCAGCGAACDVTAHLFVDGKCAQCGMSYFTYEHKKANEASPKPPVTEVFSDISGAPANSYYIPAVQRLYEAGIMSGSGDVFNIDGGITNVELRLVIARICGAEGTYDSDWQAVQKAVNAWADEHGYHIAGENNAPATREDILYNLWFLAGSPKSDHSLSEFADADDVDPEHLEAIRWAVENGILRGMPGPDGKLCIAPADPIRRKDVATIVVRYVDAANIII